MKPKRTIPEIVRYIRENFSKPNSLNYQSGDSWDHTSTEEFMDCVKYVALGLRSLGVKKGDMVGILANSSPRWTMIDLAIMCTGAVSVPLFANISYENFNYEISLCHIKHIFVDGDEQWEMFDQFADQFSVAISIYEPSARASSIFFDELIEKGRALEKDQPDYYETMLDEVQPDDMATIIFTSGTTGVPKGAMFYHKNICGQVTISRFNIKHETDKYLNILPLAHIFARAVNFVMLAWGVPVYFVKDVTTVGLACKELKPTFMIVVPRLLEKIHAKMLFKVQESGFLKRIIGSWAFRLAANEKSNLYTMLMRPIADILVYSKLREALGGKLRVVASGGAKLSTHLHHFFINIGIPVYEGWGLTEGGVICIEPMGGVRFGSVGTPFQGFTLKISEEGEVLVKGLSVMQGYYKNEEETKKAFTDDGWLRTGDKGSIDEDGYLYIESRLKEIYKTSTGEVIVPVPIEQELAKAPLVDIAMVVGDDKKFATCLLFPDFEIVKKTKKAKKMADLSDEEFLKSKYVKKMMNRLLRKVNKDLNHWEQIIDYRFILTTPSIEGGELTPTLKLRREVILESYQSEIESMYQNN